MKKLFTLYSTFPEYEKAIVTARRLLDEKLVACVNIIDGAHSFYMWEGKMQECQEAIMIAKTTETLCQSAVSAIRALHPYDIPCITVLEIVGGDEEYLHWIRQQTN